MANDHPLLFDFDDSQDFKTCSAKITEPSTHNFAVEFNADSTRCMVDLTSDQIIDLFRSGRSPGQGRCRWLNVWAANDAQRKAIMSLVVSSYGVSPRLAHLMCRRTSTPPQHVAAVKPRGDVKTSVFERGSVLEKASPSSSAESHDVEAASTPGSIDITKDLWHFFTLDWGRHYVCIGYNALFTTSSIERNRESRKPSALRVWSTVLLCDDGTVISVYDIPPDVQLHELETIRRNQVNVLKNLSRHYDTSQQNPLFQVNIRPTSTSEGEGGEERFDAFSVASHLFYYLFDDWRATFELVSGRHHPYRNTLDGLRHKMSRLAEVDDVNALHQIGRKLVVLHRVYQSYEKMVDRLLQRQRQLPASRDLRQRQLSDTSLSSIPLYQSESLRNPTVGAPYPETYDMDNNQVTVRLPLGTIARLERLLDRIRLFALTEIEECIAEKESLVMMVSYLPINLAPRPPSSSNRLTHRARPVTNTLSRTST